MGEKARRSNGVTVLAGLAILIGISLPVVVGRFLAIWEALGGVTMPTIKGFHVLRWVLGSAWIIVGLAMFQLRHWARRAYMGLLGCMMLLGSFFIVLTEFVWAFREGPIFAEEVLSFVGHLVWFLGPEIVLLFYLTLPSVKAQFEGKA